MPMWPQGNAVLRSASSLNRTTPSRALEPWQRATVFIRTGIVFRACDYAWAVAMAMACPVDRGTEIVRILVADEDSSWKSYSLVASILMLDPNPAPNYYRGKSSLPPFVGRGSGMQHVVLVVMLLPRARTS